MNNNFDGSMLAWQGVLRLISFSLNDMQGGRFLNCFWRTVSRNCFTKTDPFYPVSAFTRPTLSCSSRSRDLLWAKKQCRARSVKAIKQYLQLFYGPNGTAQEYVPHITFVGLGLDKYIKYNKYIKSYFHSSFIRRSTFGIKLLGFW